MPQFLGAIERVDGDQRQPGQRRTELQHYPLWTVRRPDRHPLTRHETAE